MKKSALVLFLIIISFNDGWSHFNSWNSPASNYVYNFGGATAQNSLNFLETQNVATYTETVSSSNLGWLPAPSSGKGFMYVGRNSSVPNNGRFDLLPSGKPHNSMRVRIPYGGVTKMALFDMENATSVCRFSINITTGNVNSEKGIMRIGLGNYDSEIVGSFTNSGNFTSNGGELRSDIFSVLLLEHTQTGIDLKIRTTANTGATVSYRTIKSNAFALNTSYEIELFVNNSLYPQTYQYDNNNIPITSGTYHIWINGEQLSNSGKSGFPSALAGAPELPVNKVINAMAFNFVSGNEDPSQSSVFTIGNIRFDYANAQAPVYSSPIYNYPVFSLELANFYNSLDFDNIPGLNFVKQAVDNANYIIAAKELKKYFLANSNFAQNIYNVKNLVQSNIPQSNAEQYLQRTYSFQGVTYTFPNGIDWLYNPTGINGIEYNQEWVVNTVRFRSMPVIANAYRATKDERFAAEAIYLMLDFIKKFPVPNTGSHSGSIPPEFDRLMYSRLSVSSRLESTIYGLLSVVESPTLTDEAFITILQGIYNHLLRMEKYPYLDYHNMGVADAQVLHQAAVSFPEFKKCAEWAQWGIERALDQMQNVVYPDGVEKELCPSYHQGVMGNFLEFMTNANLSGSQVPNSFVERLNGMAEFLVKISRPDGTIPAFNEMRQSNGNSSSIRTRVRSISNATNNQGALKWFESEGTSGTIPTYKSTSLDWAGYYVMRSGWGNNDNHMVIKAGPYGTAHQQEDKLSFELFTNGELFLVDPGFYTYNTQSMWRKYYQSSMAHNTVVPNRLSQYRYGRKALYENLAPNDALWISNEKYDFLSAEYNNGYADYQYLHTTNPNPLLEITHQRDIMFIKPGLWLVLDWMNPKDNNEHLYEALFQSQKPVESVNNSVVIKGNQSDLHIIPFTKSNTVLSTNVTSNQTDPFRRGLIFDVDNQENLPLPTGVVSQTSIGNTVQAYFIIPGNQTPITAHQIQPLDVVGGVGGRLITADGLKISFIAQKTSGTQITGGGISTDGRLKLVLENTNEIFEIEGSTLPEFSGWENPGNNFTYDFSGARGDYPLYKDNNSTLFTNTSTEAEPGWLPTPLSGSAYLFSATGTIEQPNNGRFDLDLLSNPKNLKIRVPHGGVTKFSLMDINAASEIVRFSTMVNFGSVENIRDKALMRIAIGNKAAVTSSVFTNTGNLTNNALNGDVYAAVGFEYNSSTRKVTLKVRRTNPVGTYVDVKPSYFDLNTNYLFEIIGNNSAVIQKYNYGSNINIELLPRTYHIYANGIRIDYADNFNFPEAVATGSTPELAVNHVINAIGFWVLSGNQVAQNPTVTISNIRFDYAVSTIPLPVSLTSFIAQQQNGGVKLNWTTASEQNNSHFDVLRSVNGKDFLSITQVSSAGNSSKFRNYSYTDYQPFSGVNYYKLMQVDFDGRTTESEVQFIKTVIDEDAFSIYQEENNLVASVYVNIAVNGNIKVSDIFGNMLLEKDLVLESGYTKVNLGGKYLKPGVYIAKIIVGNKSKAVKFLYSQ